MRFLTNAAGPQDKFNKKNRSERQTFLCCSFEVYSLKSLDCDNNNMIFKCLVKKDQLLEIIITQCVKSDHVTFKDTMEARCRHFLQTKIAHLR